MKKLNFVICLILFLGCIFLLKNQVVLAHVIGQPPFFKINGKASNLYHVPPPQISSFDVPQDDGPEKYQVNQKLSFEIDVKALQVSPDIVKKTKFMWDYGDGTTAEGLINTHSYSNVGSYIVIIKADTSALGDNSPPQIFESVIVHVLSDKNYKLPEAVIKVNARQSKDPLADVLEFKTRSQLSFDATSSQDGSTKIATYQWNFGDGAFSDKPIENHTYKPEFLIMFPILRIKDANGFISDAFVEIDQKKDLVNQTNSNKPTETNQKGNIKTNFSPILLILPLIVVGIIFVLKRKK